MKALLGKYPLLVTRLILGSIFVAASIDKIAQPEAFAKIIYNYQILPDSLINIAALALPWLEAVLGLSIIAGIWLPGAAVLSNLLLATFFSTLLYNIARGLDVHCGCFSVESTGAPRTAWYLARDSLFLLLGVVFLIQVFRGKRQKQPTNR
ncbi:MAG: MauE/DoxX family redox-associated membrane protein [Syntrophobacteraceae bacterium]